mmetsp:Transcript_93535/g.129904  ORF Transcript_93535/g.129904 Transcript_93535/m.129904 type:complete len:80 (+) Transcript_93535:334-573(+)
MLKEMFLLDVRTCITAAAQKHEEISQPGEGGGLRLGAVCEDRQAQTAETNEAGSKVVLGVPRSKKKAREQHNHGPCEPI